eukprot:Pgem_evm1s11284
MFENLWSSIFKIWLVNLAEGYFPRMSIQPPRFYFLWLMTKLKETLDYIRCPDTLKDISRFLIFNTAILEQTFLCTNEKNWCISLNSNPRGLEPRLFASTMSEEEIRATIVVSEEEIRNAIVNHKN